MQTAYRIKWETPPLTALVFMVLVAIAGFVSLSFLILWGVGIQIVGPNTWCEILIACIGVAGSYFAYENHRSKSK